MWITFTCVLFLFPLFSHITNSLTHSLDMFIMEKPAKKAQTVQRVKTQNCRIVNIDFVNVLGSVSTIHFLYSYDTVVACYLKGSDRLYKTVKQYSNTTTRHINRWIREIAPDTVGPVSPRQLVDLTEYYQVEKTW